MAEASKAQGEQKSTSMKMTVYGISMKFPSVRNISCAQLEQWRGDDQRTVVCLDTRPVEEYNISHLPGAVRVDPNGGCTLEVLGISPESTIVCYCSVGYRSSSFAQKLFSNHRKAMRQKEEQDPNSERRDMRAADLDIYNLEGGVFQWACEGREIVDEEGVKASTVHPYSSFWGKLLPARLRHKM